MYFWPYARFDVVHICNLITFWEFNSDLHLFLLQCSSIFRPTLHLAKLPSCYWLTALPDVFRWPQYPSATVSSSQVSNLKHLPQISSVFCVSSLGEEKKKKPATHLHNLSLLQVSACLIRHWRISLCHLLSPHLGKVKLGFPTELEPFQRKVLMLPLLPSTPGELSAAPQNPHCLPGSLH